MSYRIYLKNKNAYYLNKKRGDRKLLENYDISRSEPNTKLPSKVMLIILEKILLGAIWGKLF